MNVGKPYELKGKWYFICAGSTFGPYETQAVAQSFADDLKEAIVLTRNGACKNGSCES